MKWTLNFIGYSWPRIRGVQTSSTQKGRKYSLAFLPGEEGCWPCAVCHEENPTIHSGHIPRSLPPANPPGPPPPKGKNKSQHIMLPCIAVPPLLCKQTQQAQCTYVSYFDVSVSPGSLVVSGGVEVYNGSANALKSIPANPTAITIDLSTTRL